MSVIGRGKQDQFNSFGTVNVAIVPGRNVEEVAFGDVRLGARVDHTNH